MFKVFKGSKAGSSLVSQDFAAVVERHRVVEAATTSLVKTCKKCEEALLEMNKGRSKLREEVLSLPLFEPERHKRADSETLLRRITMFKNATEGLLELGRGLVREMGQGVAAQLSITTDSPPTNPPIPPR